MNPPPGNGASFVPDDPLVQLLQAVARLDARMEDMLRRQEKIEAQLGAGDQDVLRRLTAIEAAQIEAERKRDEARATAARAHADVIARIEQVEARQEAAAALGRWRWSAWQVLVGLVAIAGGLVAMAFAIADHT
jgi:hypothetical protein